MEEDDEEMFQKHFASYHEVDIGADDLEELYEKVHSSIREDPTPEDKEAYEPNKEFHKLRKKSYEQRRADATAKRLAIRKALGGDADDEEEEAEEDDE